MFLGLHESDTEFFETPFWCPPEVRLILKIFYVRGHDTVGHLIRVSSLASELGKALELTKGKMRDLQLGALLHDIGKIALEDGILHKTTPLRYDEYDKVKMHPLVGHELLRDCRGLARASDIILYHHEHYDGTGYPYGLKGEKIPFLARICSVADAFDAMTSERDYHKGDNKTTALDEILGNSGTQFDPHIVEIFSKIRGH